MKLPNLRFARRRNPVKTKAGKNQNAEALHGVAKLEKERPEWIYKK